ncbi:hypothetical protein J2TS6_06680 [Paenibacillus albilobatus]|uniref:Uncharacterized protein n=1 Tax=Paenibacillus albilobatus TaxID=2716884 RepID=A0A919XET4_9BACL|nr:hypothetical protein J2TS6_06680 [Paenibacillus albilobatus]
MKLQMAGIRKAFSLWPCRQRLKAANEPIAVFTGRAAHDPPELSGEMLDVFVSAQLAP